MLNDIIWTFFIPIICFFSLLTNILNIVIFNKLKPMNKSYNLLYIKSFVNVTYLFSSMFVFVTRCGIFCTDLKDSYIAKFYTLFVLYYFTSSLGLLDLIIEVIISVKRYLKLINSTLVDNLMAYQRTIYTVMFVYSFLQFFPVLISYRIVEVKSNSTNYFSKHELKLKDNFKYLLYLDEVSWFIVRILLLISLSVLVNVLIFKKFKKSARVLLTLRRKSHGNFAIISRKRNLISYFILSFN